MCLNSDVWIQKAENWKLKVMKTKIKILYVKCLESENLKTKMCELGCVNT